MSREELKEQKKIDQLITRQLKQEWHRHKWEKILLLLGNCNSGKTTLIKQLNNAFGKGLSEDTRKKHEKAVHQNVQMIIKALLQTMSKLSIEYEKPANKDTWRYFAGSDLSTMEISKSDYSMVSQLWQDRGVHSRRREFHLPDSAGYFLDNLDRIQSNNYTPSMQDILRVYGPTQGVEEHSIAIGSMSYRVVDVARTCLDMQRKWIHFFNEFAVSAVLFVVDISEYDQMLVSSEADSGMVNSLENSRALFQKLSHYQYENFKNSVFILLFNKVDIFNEKIHYSHLASHFPSYTGPKQNAEKAKNFIRDMFTDSIPDKYNYISIHFISAINSSSAREVCTAVKHGVTRIYEFNSLSVY